ncbi:amidohydrolase family protein [Pseudovibrio sp. WM33]|uniref:amidohydrolase family protein n=1 Tax=Pseudovibrio sp. WM33 TaxID=1735585 RepID=UPI0009EF06C1|nr:amidohydrolase family protein [Pseudovibrio sp. WM33]
MARRYNDYLAEKVSANPSRFSGFAALPMHHPEAAIEELTRCVNKLGFVGALVDGYSRMDDGRAIYYDTPEYAPFWQTVEELNVPFYLHPAMPSETCAYKGREFMLGPVFGFAVETLLHSYRLIGSGLFDRHPNLNIVLGHLAEAYAFTVWRSDRWLQDFSKGYEAEKEISYYFRHIFLLRLPEISLHNPS